MPANRESSLAERALNKPYYLLRPSQVIRRIRDRRRTPAGVTTARVPWGMLDVFPRDEIGLDIWRTGVYELVASETIARLLDPGELAVDAGANVGYMTSLMASRVGADGRVIAYEPHPELQPVLRVNAARAPQGCEVAVVPAALSDHGGEGVLEPGENFARNMGTAALIENGAPSSGDTLPVRLERLDDRLAGDARVGLLKVDVEGHELRVLRGAMGALSEGRIRDIVFEEGDPLPTLVTRELEALGYMVYGLDQRPLGPRLLAPSDPRACPLWGAPTYLATLDPERARSRMRRRGWRVLRESRASRDVGSTA